MKIKHGHSLEITKQLTPEAADVIAQWIGCATVITNQKTVKSKEEYIKWIDGGKIENEKPITNQETSYLTKTLDFLKSVPCQIRRNAGSKWMQSMNAALIGLRKHPQIKPKHKKRNCFVTSELFDVQALDKNRCLIQLKIDATNKTKGRYLAGFVMPFPKEDAGKAFYLSRKGSRYWLSMSYDLDVNALCEQEIKAILLAMTDEELAEVITGFDLGVRKQVTSSNGTVYHMPDQAQEKIDLIYKRKKKYQRTYAKVALANDKAASKKQKEEKIKAKAKNKVSKKTTDKVAITCRGNYTKEEKKLRRKNKINLKAEKIKRDRTKKERKLLEKIAKQDGKIAAIKMNNSHHISKAIADTTPLVGAFEDMRITNIVRRAKAKQDPVTGKWLKNGATAKTALNKSISNANMGQIRALTAYKLKDRGRLMIKINPRCTSQECSVCEYTHADNRKTQAEFSCQQCGHAENADINAAKVIKKRCMKHIRSDAFSKRGGYPEKTVRKTSARKGSKKAHEPASLDSGGYVRLSVSEAESIDALNPLSREVLSFFS